MAASERVLSSCYHDVAKFMFVYGKDCFVLVAGMVDWLYVTPESTVSDSNCQQEMCTRVITVFPERI